MNTKSPEIVKTCTTQRHLQFDIDDIFEKQEDSLVVDVSPNKDRIVIGFANMGDKSMSVRRIAGNIVEISFYS